MGNVSLKMLLERLSSLRFVRNEMFVGMGPESWLAATVRLTRFLRWPMSGERVPVRLRLEMSREMTWRRESQVTPDQVQ